MKHFYSHLVDIDSLTVELHTLPLSDAEKFHLHELIEKNMHHVIMDAILSELSEEDKKKFLELVAHDKHEHVWDHLKDKTQGIEEKIKKAADELKKELHKDIKESK